MWTPLGRCNMATALSVLSRFSHVKRGVARRTCRHGSIVAVVVNFVSVPPSDVAAVLARWRAAAGFHPVGCVISVRLHIGTLRATDPSFRTPHRPGTWRQRSPPTRRAESRGTRRYRELSPYRARDVEAGERRKSGHEHDLDDHGSTLVRLLMHQGARPLPIRLGLRILPLGERASRGTHVALLADGVARIPGAAVEAPRRVGAEGARRSHRLWRCLRCPGDVGARTGHCTTHYRTQPGLL